MRTSLAKTMLVGIASTAFALGAFSLIPQTSGDKGDPCGPTIRWSCSKSPMGPATLFVGNACEAERYERKTGSLCVPLGR